MVLIFTLRVHALTHGLLPKLSVVICLVSGLATIALIDLPWVREDLHRSVSYSLGVMGAVALPFLTVTLVLVSAPNLAIQPAFRKLLACVLAAAYVAVLPPLVMAGAIFGCAWSGAPSCL